MGNPGNPSKKGAHLMTLYPMGQLVGKYTRIGSSHLTPAGALPRDRHRLHRMDRQDALKTLDFES